MPVYQYLVMLRCNIDDYPLRLFDDKDSAIRYAKRCRDVPPKSVWHQFTPDVSQAIEVAVVTFTNGAPTSNETIKLFDGTAA